MNRYPIYKPKGAAFEYGELALNIYRGCPHGCSYCYVPGVLHKTSRAFEKDLEPYTDIVERVEYQLSTGDFKDKTIFLCFACDPYPYGRSTLPTRLCIELIKKAGAHVKLLTKRPNEALKDVDLFDSEDWVGTTITGAPRTSELWADMPGDRLYAIERFHARHINTWLSCEPVVDPHVIYKIITEVDYVDRFYFGRMNYRRSDVDWREFGYNIMSLCKNHKRNYVIKKSLENAMKSKGKKR